MRKYDFEQVEHFINENSERLASVKMGIAEDWITSEEIWNCKTGFKYYFPTLRTINEIEGSTWGTPIMLCEFLDGSELRIPCYYGKADCDRPNPIATILCALMGMPIGDK